LWYIFYSIFLRWSFFSAFSRLISSVYFLLRLVFFYDFLLLRLVFFSTSLRLVFFKIYLEIGVFFAFLELMGFFFIVFFNWKQQVRTLPHIKTLSQLKSKWEPTFDSKKPESQLCLRWMFLFSCLFWPSYFFDLLLRSMMLSIFLRLLFFSIFSWDWCFFDFPELCIFFSVSFQIALLGFLDWDFCLLFFSTFLI
jgi:hypothetical protein